MRCCYFFKHLNLLVPLFVSEILVCSSFFLALINRHLSCLSVLFTWHLSTLLHLGVQIWSFLAQKQTTAKLSQTRAQCSNVHLSSRPADAVVVRKLLMMLIHNHVISAAWLSCNRMANLLCCSVSQILTKGLFKIPKSPLWKVLLFIAVENWENWICRQIWKPQKCLP